MKRLALTLILAAAVSAAVGTGTASAASSCNVTVIAKPSLGGLIGVYDRMVGNCNPDLPGGYQMALNMQFEQGGTWHFDNPSVYLAAIPDGTWAALDNTWPDVSPNCAYNWRGLGQWQDSTGGIIASRFSATLAKTC